MTAFIILCFMILIGLGIVAYLFASEKKPIPQPALPEQSLIEEVEKMPPQEKWTIGTIKREFDSVKNEINQLESIKDKSAKGAAVKGFFSRVSYAFRLTMQEKEIITFAILQWTAIAIGYYL